MRKLGKKSALKRYYQQASEAQMVQTNLEKKTQEKIHKMSNNDALTMDFVLKNRKLLEHLKKCKVFLSKSMRKNLLKKYALLNNPISRKANHGKASKVKTGRSGEDNRLNVSFLNGMATKDSADGTCASPPNLRPHRVIMATPKTPKVTKNDSPPQTSKPAKQNVSTPSRNVPSPGPIFIRLPPKTNKRTIQKRQIFAKSIDKANLIRRFGKMVFKCHVRVKRLKKTDPIFTKKFKTNRKTVSFMETVEVFGESDIEYESEDSIDVTQSSFAKISHTSSPLQGLKTKQSKSKSPKVQKRKPIKESTETQSKNKRAKKLKQNIQNPEKIKSPVKATSPQKKTGSSPKKANQQIRGSPNKQRSPNKQQTEDIRLSLIEGKECYVKLNRSSTSLLNLSIGLENGEIEESNGKPTSIEASEITEATTETSQNEVKHEKESSEILNGSSANGDVTNHLDDVEIMEDEEQTEQNNIDGKTSDENNLEPVRLDNDGEEDVAHDENTENNLEENDDNVNNAETDDVTIVEKSSSDNDVVNLDDDTIGTNKENDNTNKNDSAVIDDEDEPIFVENTEEREVEKGNNPDSNNDPDDCEKLEDEGNEVQIVDDKIGNLSKNSSPAEERNGKNADKNNRTISARNNISSIEESKDEQDGKFSERKLSTPAAYRRGKFDKIDRSETRAVSASPIHSGSKTNGTKRTSDSPATDKTMPENSEDLFDLLKSNKLPDNDQSSNRVPSPLPELSDDEGEPTSKLNKDATSPAIDLAEESNSSANDSRFSLNTFFKSSNRTGNESPGKSPPSTDEINLKNPDSNIDSPKSQEITTQ